MTKTELTAYRRVLENKQTEIGDGSISREALAIQASPDELDRIQHATDRDYAISNLERNTNRLREVQSALHRIERGTFGICIGCDEKINSKRLAAIPWASSCIVCQEAADQGEATAEPENDFSPAMAF